MSNKTPLKTGRNNKPMRVLSSDEIKQLLISADFTISPKGIVKDIQKLMLESDKAAGKQKEVFTEKLEAKLNEALNIVALDKHNLIAEALHFKKYQILAIEVADQLISEYGCKTTSEKMLAETASWAYCRMLEFSYRLSDFTQLDFLGTEKITYYSGISQEVDRANRQFTSAVHLLRQMKQPKLNVTFKAHNTFVAQNQQVNAQQNGASTEKNNAG